CGFDASVSSFRAGSAARSERNVTVPCCRTPGSPASASPSATFSWPRARANPVPLVTSSARSSRRDAIAVVALAPFTTRLSKVFWSRASSPITRDKLPSDGARYLKVSWRFSLWPTYQPPKPLSTPCRPLRAVGYLGRVVGTGLQRQVAVRHRRQRGLTHGHRRSLVQRGEVVVDRDLDVGLVVLGQLDVRDLADREAADLDLVALHQLVRRLVKGNEVKVGGL